MLYINIYIYIYIHIYIWFDSNIIEMVRFLDFPHDLRCAAPLASHRRFPLGKSDILHPVFQKGLHFFRKFVAQVFQEVFQVFGFQGIAWSPQKLQLLSRSFLCPQSHLRNGGKYGRPEQTEINLGIEIIRWGVLRKHMWSSNFCELLACSCGTVDTVYRFWHGLVQNAAT